METNIEIGAQSEIDRRTRRERNTETRTRRTRRRSRPRKVRRSTALQWVTSSRKKSSWTSFHEGKSMLKHIMRKCKVVNYVDKETSSGTQISSRRRSSRTTLARLHSSSRTQSLARKVGLQILGGTNGND